MRRAPVVIVGGGIGGLAAARALSIAGQPSIVAEQAPRFEEVGAGIQLGPNAFRVLDLLGVREQVEAAAAFPDDLIVMDGLSAEEITRIPVTGDFRSRFGQPYALVHRADLHRSLLDACLADPCVQLRPATTITAYEDTGEEVIVTTSDGATIHAGAIVGADGLWSKTRDAIIGDGAPRVSGHIAYRAVVDREHVEEELRRNAMVLWAGPGNHLVQYPLRGGRQFNLVAVFHSDRFVDGWNREGEPEELHRRFADNCSVVKTLLGKVGTWRMWVLCDREPVKVWSRGRATLLGDAAHPMLQYLAQGAGMALEDAVVLARCLVEAAGEHVRAFAAYSARRYLRAGRCQVMARVHGGFYHARGVSRELATAFLARRTAAESFDSLAWLYDFDPGPIGRLNDA